MTARPSSVPMCSGALGVPNGVEQDSRSWVVREGAYLSVCIDSIFSTE
jgi:hypothetical protein